MWSFSRKHVARFLLRKMAKACAKREDATTKSDPENWSIAGYQSDAEIGEFKLLYRKTDKNGKELMHLWFTVRVDEGKKEF